MMTFMRGALRIAFIAGSLFIGFIHVIPGYGQQPAIPLVGTVATASPAETVAVNGNIVYACDMNEISVIDVTKPSAPSIVGTVSSPASTTNTYCDVQRGVFVQMINTSAPSFRAYSVTNPNSPSLVSTTTVNKTYFGPPYYLGNTAYFNTNYIVFGSGYPGPITDQAGDFVSMDVTNLNSPVVLGTLENQTHSPAQGGSFNVYGAVPYNDQLAYVAATSSQGGTTQTGVGQLWVADTTNPSAMSMVTSLNVPGTLQVFGPLVQGNTLVTIGGSGGWREPCCGTDAFTGNVVVTVYDLTDPRNPAIVSNVTTAYTPGASIGAAAAVIGQHRFLYGGVLDSGNNNNFMIVDTTNPASPVITLSGTPTSVNYVQIVGTQLYAGTATGFQIYSIAGSIAPAIATNGVENGASYQPGLVANSWATITGNNLSLTTDTWNKFIVNNKLPTALDGVSVSMGGMPAYVEYVSATQVNVLAPNVSPGPVQVSVRDAVGISSTFTLTASAYGPAFFPWPNNQPVATRQDFSYAVKPGTFAGLTTVAAKPGDVIILWGTGFGPTSPAAPAGQVVPSNQTYSTTTLPTVTINNVQATVYGAALAPGFAGLYQVAIQVPSSLGNGDWPIVATIGGVSSPSGVLLTVQQ